MENSRELKLSWYRGRTILKSTNSAVMSSKLSLPLEINSYDGDSYSCVAENPVEEKATKLLKEETCLKDGGMMMNNMATKCYLSFHIYIISSCTVRVAK